MAVKIFIRVPTVTYTHVEISLAEQHLIESMYRKEDMVTVIRFMREQYGMGLKETKDLCDTVHANAINIVRD